MCVYIYIYIHKNICMYIYIYIYIRGYDEDKVLRYQLWWCMLRYVSLCVTVYAVLCYVVCVVDDMLYYVMLCVVVFSHELVVGTLGLLMCVAFIVDVMCVVLSFPGHRVEAHALV